MQVFSPMALRRHSWLLRTVTLMISVIGVVTLLSQSVFAENTYVITDGNTVLYHSSYATEPTRILEEAGIVLDENDTFITHDGDETGAITVCRGMNVTLTVGDHSMTVCSYGETVGELLERLEVRLCEDTELSVSQQTPVSEGMEIRVDTVQTLPRYYLEQIPYETVICYDPTAAEGYREVIRSGVPGKLFCTAEALVINGEELQQTLTAETVLEEPRTEVIVQGTGENLDGHWQTPAVGDGVLVTWDGQVLFYNDVIQSETTAYTKTDAGCDDYTATGTYARVGAVAVDPKVIPYFTKLFIISNDGEYVYGYCSAEDCGGAIKGNRIDIYYDTTAECFQFGRRDCTVYVLTEE